MRSIAGSEEHYERLLHLLHPDPYLLQTVSTVIFTKQSVCVKKLSCFHTMRHKVTFQSKTQPKTNTQLHEFPEK